jgi:hypothetical protein
MSDTILGGDFTVYYGAENRQKRITWSGSATGTRSVNELYSALQDLFDELTQMDDGTPMSAQTPTEYTIGIIDAGDRDPWFIDRESVEHLFGGALKTASWSRTTGSNTGVVRLLCDNDGGIVAGDIGLDITLTGGHSGTLLDIRGSGTSTYLWIRPDSSAASNNFDASGTLTVNGHTATFTYDVTPPDVTWATGESLWANIYSIGTLEDQDITHLYVIQDGTKLISEAAGSTYDWWPDGHIDILVRVKEVDVEIDEAVVQVFARHYTKTYDHFEVDLTTGGRNPIPLSTGEDLNNTTGYWNLPISSVTGTFDVGNYIYVGASWAAATKKGVITAVNGSSDLDYYLIGDLTNFANSDSIQEYDPLTESDGDASATAGTPAANGPAALAGVSITHGGASLEDGGSFDIDENGTPENYSIIIDCNSTSLSEVYEWTKYITRRGETTADSNTDGMDGEQYIGSDYKITYSGGTGTLTEGNEVVGATSGATGTVVQVNTTDNIVILRNSRGTFTSNEQVNESTNNITGTSFTRISPIKSAPFGTFAGGKWFCAPGVVLTNVAAADANNYQLTDDDGNVVIAPTKVSVAVTNTRAGDRIAVFRLSSGVIEKDYYSVNADASAGDTSITVTPAIRIDEPGKSSGGVLRVVDTSANEEYRLRFSSWSSPTFTLASTTGLTADAGTNTTTIVDAGGSFSTNAKVGDLIRNVTAGGYGYVTEVVSNTEISTTEIAGQTTGDSYEINTVPVSLEDGTPGPADTVYVPFIDVYETTGDDGSPGTEETVVTFDSSVSVRVRARQAGDILPYESPATISSSGMSNNIIRTPDPIFTP